MYFMEQSKDLCSACGLYCGVCGVYIATQSHNSTLKEKLAQFYGVEPQAIQCNGCNSDLTCLFCKSCKIKECAQNKKIEGCHQCSTYPCEKMAQFSVPIGKKNILRCVPFRRAFGDDLWIQEEIRRYKCKNCGYQIFRGSKRCGNCKEPVSPD